MPAVIFIWSVEEDRADTAPVVGYVFLIRIVHMQGSDTAESQATVAQMYSLSHVFGIVLGQLYERRRIRTYLMIKKWSFPDLL